MEEETREVAVPKGKVKAMEGNLAMANRNHVDDRQLLSEILDCIYGFFPRNSTFDSEEHKCSDQYCRLLSRRREQQHDGEFAESSKHLIAAIFSGYAIRDLTNLSEYNCYEYQALMHKNCPPLDWDEELIKSLGGEKLESHVYLSILGPYYYVSLDRTKLDALEWHFENLKRYPSQLTEVMSSLKRALKRQGYGEIGREVADAIVPGVETELHENGETKVFHCLFSDLLDTEPANRRFPRDLADCP